MLISANFSTDLDRNVNLQMEDDDGLMINKTINFYDFKEAINNCKFTGELTYCCIDKLPSTFLKGYFAVEKNLTGRIALFIPEMIQRMAFVTLKDSEMIPFPSLIMFIDIVEGVIENTDIFSIKEEKSSQVDDTTLLFNYPYGNVSPYTGRICWGSNPLPIIESFKMLDELILLFINSPTNNDLYLPMQSVNKNISLIKLIKSQAPRSNFNKKLLVPTNISFLDFMSRIKY
jgi:hypothetical protein